MKFITFQRWGSFYENLLQSRNPSLTVGWQAERAGTRSIQHLLFLFLSPDPVPQGEPFQQKRKPKHVWTLFSSVLRDLADHLGAKWQDWPEFCGPLFKEKNWETKCGNLASSKASGKSDLPVQKLNSSQFLFCCWLLKLSCLLPLQKDMSHPIETLLQHIVKERNYY